VAVAEDALGLRLCAPEKPAITQKAVIKTATLSFMFSFRLWICSQSTSRDELALPEECANRIINEGEENPLGIFQLVE
jgi:hypothetical protein